MGSSGAGNLDEPKLDLRFSNAEVEEILDAVAIGSASNIWIVTFSESLALTPTGFRRTVTIWNGSFVPDDQQPVWDRFRWQYFAPSVLH
jgi:hypothetical protein